MNRPSRPTRLPVTLFAILLTAATTPSLQAQGAKAKKLTIPKPEMLSFDSLGVTIQYTYFPGGFVQKSDKEVVAKPGKEVVPIILLHGFEGQGSDMGPLAVSLQRMGHAVVMPDLRGHGRSKYRGRGRSEVPPDKLTRNDFVAMVGDVEILKKFLYEKNNQGLVNIELLCLVGADLGGLVATNWIAMDWSRADLPAFKQGKSAKALVVLSPVGSIKGYSAGIAWRHDIFQFPPKMSIMLVAGTRDSESSSETKQIYNRLEKVHRPNPNAADKSRQSLWLIEPDTELSGSKLVDPRYRLPVSKQVQLFIKTRLADRHTEFPWAERKSPLDPQ